jgi:hypothetical protein
MDLHRHRLTSGPPADRIPGLSEELTRVYRNPHALLFSPVLPENLNLLKGLTLTPRALILDYVCFGPYSSIVMRSR